MSNPIVRFTSFLTVCLCASCSTDSDGTPVGVGRESVAELAKAAARTEAREKIAVVRGHFVRRAPIGGRALTRGSAFRPRPVIPPGEVERFEMRDHDRIFAIPRRAGLRGISRSATVAAPIRADGSAFIRDDTSGLQIEFGLQGSKAVTSRPVDGIVLYPNAAAHGGHVLHRPHGAGVEDYVVFDGKPSVEEVRYEVDVSRVPGLRLLHGVLEFLDQEGFPRLRVAPPFLVDTHGSPHFARITLEGCAHDSSPRPPWGRPVTPPAATSCELVLNWENQDVAYPAILDPAWSTTGQMICERTGHVAALMVTGDVLVAGGAWCGPDNVAELYHTSGVWSATGPMVAQRSGATATVLPNDAVLVAGGDFSATADLFDSRSSQWRPAGNMTAVRFEHTASLINGQVLVAGGRSGTEALSTAEIYNPASDSWSPAGAMTEPRTLHAASVLSATNQVLVTGGTNNDRPNALPRAETYDPIRGWQVHPNALMEPRLAHSAVVLPDGRVLLSGGADCSNSSCGASSLASAEIFEPGVGWSLTGDLPTPQQGHTSTLLPNGWVLNAGGEHCEDGDCIYLAAASLFDPSASTWWAIDSMVDQRNHHTAVLIDDEVLIAGGSSCIPPGVCSLLAQAELFSPAVNGTGCTLAGECKSGFCVDGICCNEACDAPCRTCAASPTGPTSPGVCRAAPPGPDPRGLCADQGAASCGTTGECDDTGSCVVYPAGTICAQPVCQSGVFTTSKCNGQLPGTCVQTSVSCDPYGCNSSQCGQVCTTSSECAATAYCDGGFCAPLVPDGAPCTDPTGCNSGFCVDNYCCNQPCALQCEACDVHGGEGTCVPVSGAPHGNRPACPAGSPENPCSEATCNALVRETCAGFVGPYVACRSNTCENGVAIFAALCEGGGQCPQPQTKQCDPYTCDAETCNTECLTDLECAGGSSCDTSTGRCVTAAVCVDQTTLRGPTGATTSCSPYNCEGSACLVHCNSVEECAPGYLCDRNHACVPRDSVGGESTEDGGCGCGLPGRRPPDSGVALIAWLLAAIGLRRIREPARSCRLPATTAPHR